MSSAGERPLTIYFNRTYATNVHIVDMLRDNPDDRAVRVIATHADPTSPMLQACDVAAAEPGGGVTGPEYVSWALEFTARHGVDVFVPRFEMESLAQAAAQFAAQGVALLAPPAGTIRHFADKAATYADAAARGLPVPPHRVITTSHGLLDSYQEMGDAYGQVCLKPVIGVGGDGFRILDHRAPRLADIVGPLRPTVSVSAVAAALDSAAATGVRVAPLMILPYLPGPEISVDLLADRTGSTVAAVARSKWLRQRAIVDDPTAQQIAEVLVRAHQVSYLSNTQVRYWQSPQDASPVPYLLEVNTRMSGGLFQTALAGVNLAWAAVRMALNQHPAVGAARHDISYTTVPGVRPHRASPAHAPPTPLPVNGLERIRPARAPIGSRN